MEEWVLFILNGIDESALKTLILVKGVEDND
jgi:hypothetical protein